MEITINLEELQLKKDSISKEILASINWVSEEELLREATRDLENIAAERKLTVDRLFASAESNELPFSVSSVVFDLALKIRSYKQA